MIEDHSRLAELIEIYIRKGAADEGIVGDHLAYDILSTYYAVQDVLRERALKEDLAYEGFRDLALRLQDYAKIRPVEADLRGHLVWAKLPPLKYKGGDESHGYGKTIGRRLGLVWATVRDFLNPRSEAAKDRKEWAKAKEPTAAHKI